MGEKWEKWDTLVWVLCDGAGRSLAVELAGRRKMRRNGDRRIIVTVLPHPLLAIDWAGLGN